MPLPGLILSALLGQTLPAEAAAGPATVPVAMPATQPALSLEQDRADERRRTEEEYNALPRKAARPVNKIIDLRLEEGHLHVRPLLEPTGEQVRVDATDWPGYLLVTVGEEGTLQFFLKHVDLSDPMKSAVYTHVSTGPDYLQINRDSEDDEKVDSMTLIQARQFADENERPIRVTFRRTFNDDRPAQEIRVAADSFAELRQTNPRELRQYLLPVLRDLGAGELLNSSTPAVAWQVLGDSIAVDPKMDAALQSITKRLDAEDQPTRLAAEKELAALGPDAAAALRKTDLDRLPPEPATTLRQFRKQLEVMPPARAAELGKDVNFLLDTLLLDDPRLRAVAAAKLERAMGTRIDLPADLTPGERQKRVEALREQWMPSTRPATAPAND